VKEEWLYKIVFPECNKLYFGRTCSNRRYGRGNKPGERFQGPHHNKEVQNLLDQGWAAFWIIVHTSQGGNLEEKEGRYLEKVWKTGSWEDRPRWLLNRNRNPVGFSSGESHPNKKPEARKAQSIRATGNTFGRKNKGRSNDWMLGDRNHMRLLEHRERAKNEVDKLHTKEARDKARESRNKTVKDPNYINPNLGRERPDLAERNRSPEARVKASQRVSTRNRVLHACPECGMEMNVGNLTKHLRAKHGRQSGLPTE
jgi:hypothetical protein